MSGSGSTSIKHGDKEAFLADLADAAALTYDPATGRYIDNLDGRYLPEPDDSGRFCDSNPSPRTRRPVDDERMRKARREMQVS